MFKDMYYIFAFSMTFEYCIQRWQIQMHNAFHPQDYCGKFKSVVFIHLFTFQNIHDLVSHKRLQSRLSDRRLRDRACSNRVLDPESDLRPGLNLRPVCLQMDLSAE